MKSFKKEKKTKKKELEEQKIEEQDIQFEEKVEKQAELVEVKPKRSKKSKVFMILKIFLLILLLIFCFVATTSTLAFFRYRQMCSYQTLIEAGQINSSEAKICPDPLSSNGLSSILLNIFNFNFQSKLAVNNSYEGGAVGSPDECTSQTDIICWLKQAQGGLKQSNGYTNVLLVGTDSRSNSQVLGNTDSLILLSYQHSSGQTLLISFPRDLTVKFTDTRGSYVTSRINSIYAIYEIYERAGIQNLNTAISQIVGKPINYYVYFNFSTFETIINKLGGIDITLPKDFSDAYPCAELPKNVKCNALPNLPGYGLFQFKKGKHHFNSTQALIYARSRELSTDYSRNGRQQEVIKATINTALNSKASLSEKFNLYKGLFDTVNDTVKTNASISDVTGLFKLYDKLSGSVASIVVDPALGNGTIVHDIGSTPDYGWSVPFYDYTYKTLQNLIANTWKFLPYQIESPKVLVVNTTNTPIAKTSELGKLLNSGNPYWQVKIIKDTKTKYSGTRVYSMNPAKTGSLNDVLTHLPNALLYNAEIEDIKRTSYKEDILIVVGE